MFVTLRLFRLNPIFEKDFLHFWNSAVTELKIKDYINNAIMHKESRISYISYLHWRDKGAFEKASRDLEPEINALVIKMQECCNSMVVLHQMDVIANTVV